MKKIKQKKLRQIANNIDDTKYVHHIYIPRSVPHPDMANVMTTVMIPEKSRSDVNHYRRIKRAFKREGMAAVRQYLHKVNDLNRSGKPIPMILKSNGPKKYESIY